MKTALSLPAITALLGLSLSACSLAGRAEPAGKLAQGVTLDQLAFGSLGSGDQGPAQNADIWEVADWVLDDGINGAHESGLATILQGGKIPYVYFYIAAGQAKKAYGIDDCNVTSFDRSLCKWGGDYISKHVDDVVNGHAQAAQRVQQLVGGSPILIHVEPDFYQYTQDTHPGYGDQAAVHALHPEEAGAILDRIVGAIHDNCGSCSVVLDVSPWAADLGAYFSHVNMGAVSFVGLVGKGFPATSGKIDNYAYGEISGITGRQIIVNTAHGPGGGPNPYDTTWDDVGTLQAMHASGVGGVIQSNQDRGRYEATIGAYKSAQGGSSQGGPSSGPPPGQPGNFGFSVSPNVNPWWIQVHVDAPPGATVTAVSAALANGASFDLQLQSWGDWALSPSSPVPDGTSVVFTAQDDRGESTTFTSQPWP